MGEKNGGIETRTHNLEHGKTMRQPGGDEHWYVNKNCHKDNALILMDLYKLSYWLFSNSAGCSSLHSASHEIVNGC